MLTTYEEYAALPSRTPCGLLVVTLDFCANTFGVAPCTASGEPCYNTWYTCKDRPNYSRTTRDYEFTSFDAAPLPFVGPRPYLKKYKPEAAEEIKVDGKGTGKGTLTARTTFELIDDLDTDVGIDPYLDDRATQFSASFWKRFLARNPNYIKRPVRYFAGFVGLDRSQWQPRWLGDIEAMTLGNGTISIKTVDQLKRLDAINIPAKVDIKLVGDIAAGAANIILTTLTGLADPAGYIRIDDEVIAYTGTDPAQNKLTGCTTAARTVAASHSAGTKVTLVLRRSGNPWDLLTEMLIGDAGIAAGDVDTAAADACKIFPAEEPTFSTWLVESTKLADLFWELVALLDAQVWFSAEQKITFARNLPNQPGRGYTVLSDAGNVVLGSLKVDLNAESRQTEIIVNWDKTTLGDLDDEKSYGRVTVAIDGPSVGANGNGLVARTIHCRWINLDSLAEEVADDYISALAYRRLWRWAEPMALIDFEVELKDGAIRTGDYLRLSTRATLNPDGSPLAREIAQVVKRAQGKGHNLSLRVWRVPSKRLAIIAPDGTADYAAASESEKEYGFIAADDERMPADLSDGYFIW